MKLMHYNVGSDFVYLDLLKEIVLQENPDILTLGEARPEEMEALKKDFATVAFEISPGRLHGNAALLKKNARSLRSIPGLRNSLIEAVCDEFALYVCHLSARGGEDRRLEELTLLLGEASKHENYMIAGDLNSLSPHDGYDIPALAEHMQKQGHAKFGIPIRFSVISMLEDYGLVDVFHHLDVHEATVPTKEGITEAERAQHFMPLRLDYIFATRELAQKAKEARVVRNELTEKCSDHYPIVTAFVL